MTDHLQIIERLKAIHHLKLPIKADVTSLQRELSVSNPRLRDFTVMTGDQKIDDGFANLKVRGIFDVIKDSSVGEIYLTAPLRKVAPDCVVTDLGERLPEAVKLIKQIGETPQRCRLSKLEPGKTVPMHTHDRDWGRDRSNPYAYNNLTIHVPIFTNPDVLMICISPNTGHRTDVHYKEGEAWILSSWVQHGVVNYGMTDRWHLWLTYNLFARNSNIPINLNLWSLIRQALNEKELT